MSHHRAWYRSYRINPSYYSNIGNFVYQKRIYGPQNQTLENCFLCIPIFPDFKLKSVNSISSAFGKTVNAPLFFPPKNVSLSGPTWKQSILGSKKNTKKNFSMPAKTKILLGKTFNAFFNNRAKYG